MSNDAVPDIEPPPFPYRTLIAVVAAVLMVAGLLYVFVVAAFAIPTDSMEPTLESGDRLIVNKLSYVTGEIERGQVVVFERPDGVVLEGNKRMIKRVLALPGEEIRLSAGEVWIDGRRLIEPYLVSAASSFPLATVIPGCAGSSDRADRCVVPEGAVFVLGDNRDNSTDSRVYGPIRTDTIVGRATVQVWPPNAFERL